jgi:dihydrofolate reductase
MISIIVALSEDNVIGRNNQLPWRLSADLQYFRRVTMGKPIVMGRKTFESIGKPLPGRENYIITRNQNYTVSGAKVFFDVSSALDDAKLIADEVMVIGGEQLYCATLALANRLYVTEVSGAYEGDAFFPDFELSQWQLSGREPHVADEKNSADYTFKVYERVQNNLAG